MQISNIDRKTVDGFGGEWAAFGQADLPPEDHRRIFDDPFSIFPFAELPANVEGFDLGCGSGRRADLMAERVGTLHCTDPSVKALTVATRRLGGRGSVRFHHAGVDAIPLPDASQNFGYSLGVLHHIPDTETAMRDYVAKLKRDSALPRLSLLTVWQQAVAVPRSVGGERLSPQGRRAAAIRRAQGDDGALRDDRRDLPRRRALLGGVRTQNVSRGASLPCA